MAAWADLWFYSNPIFIEVRARRWWPASSSHERSSTRRRAATRGAFSHLKRKTHVHHDRAIRVPRLPVAVQFSAPTWLREPLLHFVVLGALLFGVDHCSPAARDDPRTIVVDAEVDAKAMQVFKDARGRDPNEEELYALRRVWLDNEVLYREGLAFGSTRATTQSVNA